MLEKGVIWIGFCLLTVLESLKVEAWSSTRYQISVRNENRRNTKCFATQETPSPDMSDEVITPREQEEEKVIHTDAISTVASLMLQCLIKSDIKKDAKFEENPDNKAPKGAGNWIDDASAYSLRCAIDQLELLPADSRASHLVNKLHIGNKDEAATWFRWMKAVPAPTLIELSDELQNLANSTLVDETLEMLETTRDEFLNRMGCRMVLLPSGVELEHPIQTPSGGIAYGKILYGGAKRFRLLPGGRNKVRRRTSEITSVKVTVDDHVPSWVQHGGPDRKYESVDIGSCAIMEFTILPRGSTHKMNEGDMTVSNFLWPLQNMFSFINDRASTTNTTLAVEELDDKSKTTNIISMSGGERNDAFRNTFKANVGGLESQIDMIVRRVLDGRIIRPADEELESDEDNDSNNNLARVTREAEALEALGLKPVRGLLLYGPPGTGKTLIAREISKVLRARAPKIVSTPELLDRWVGGSEKLIRDLFADAEAELAFVKGDARKSALHVVVLDEIDAVFRKRSVASDSGEATRSSAVNQILAKLDGVNSIPNVLLIGMTNRRELIDEALLRPGRLEVQIEIPLPTKEGRREILKIHFNALRMQGRLSKPLCCAIDGVPLYQFDYASLQEHQGSLRKRDKFKASIRKVFQTITPAFDLASEHITGGCSGADLAGLVRCAGSIALARAREAGSGVENLIITLEDVKQALYEIKS